jgi:hypothetical protein
METSSGPVEPEQRQLVLGREQPEDGLDVLGCRRVELLLLLVRQTDAAVTSRVRFDTGLVEDGRGVLDRLADRLPLRAGP